MARKKFFQSPVLWVFVVTLVVLAIHPIPECVACESPGAWGRNEAAYTRASGVFDAWFILASVTAGFCSVRKYWSVPAAIVVADLITQPLGGVPLWSLWSNEGPVLVLVGAIAGATFLMVGSLLRVTFRLLRSTSHPKPGQ